MKCKLHMACSPRDGFTCSAGVLEIPYTIVLSSTLGVLNEELLLLCCIGNTCDALGTLGSAATPRGLARARIGAAYEHVQ